MALSLAGGCASPATTIERDVGRTGYAIWYPPEAGIEPGQVWLADEAMRVTFADRPASMPVTQGPDGLAPDRWPRQLDFESTIAPEFTVSTLSKAGPFGAELYAGTARVGTVKVPRPTVESIDPAALADGDVAGRYGPAYAAAIRLAREGRSGVVLVTSVLRVREATFQLRCGDPYRLRQRLPRLKAITRSDIDFEVLDEHWAKLTLRAPAGGPGLTFGVLPVRGDRLTKSVAESREGFARELRFMSRQAYAVEPSVPAALGADRVALVDPGDSPETVERKYNEAAGLVRPELVQVGGATTRPAGTTQPATTKPVNPSGEAPVPPAPSTHPPERQTPTTPRVDVRPPVIDPPAPTERPVAPSTTPASNEPGPGPAPSPSPAVPSEGSGQTPHSTPPPDPVPPTSDPVLPKPPADPVPDTERKAAEPAGGGIAPATSPAAAPAGPADVPHDASR